MLRWDETVDDVIVIIVAVGVHDDEVKSAKWITMQTNIMLKADGGPEGGQ